MDSSAIKTSYAVEGYFDNLNFSATNIKGNASYKKTRTDISHHNATAKTRTWTFVICPSFGFLGSPEPLMKNCELKLSFDRSSPYTSVLDAGSATPALEHIDIKDCYAVTEYISSEPLRNFFDSITYEPIRYEYDACEVMVKSIPTGETAIRFDNIRGGRLPLAMFAAIIPQSYLHGDKGYSSTYFRNNNVEEMNITLNGNSVNGYPITIKDQSPIFPMQKFLDTTDRYYNVVSGESLSLMEFKYNFLWSHKFEAESADQGWLGVNFKLSSSYTESMSLVVWIISPTVLTLDQFNKVEKINT